MECKKMPGMKNKIWKCTFLDPRSKWAKMDDKMKVMICCKHRKSKKVI